jgi:asparagine synthetase B (glutamine-hydrolysing)
MVTSASAPPAGATTRATTAPDPNESGWPASRDSYYRLTDFEAATNWVHGILPARRDSGGPFFRSPREALAGLLAPILAKPPCYVAFSGGRDSSAVLATATTVARAEGLPDPVPVSDRYPGVAEAQEDDWQQQVVDHLSLQDWIRIEYTDENDLVGPTATEGLLKRGLLWPPPVQIKVNTLRHIGAGSLLTGEGGDEVFGPRRVASWPHLSGRTPVSRREALRGAMSSVLPRHIRESRVEDSFRRQRMQPWLREPVLDRHLRLFAEDCASEPLDWRAALLWLNRRRGALLGAHNYRLLGEEFGVTVVEPLLDPGFLTALGRAVGRWGFDSRTEAMRITFGDILPDAIVRRSQKASFNSAYMGEPTHTFAREWDGTGLDDSLVDADLLRAEWLSERPAALANALLQQAWLRTHSPAGAA